MSPEGAARLATILRAAGWTARDVWAWRADAARCERIATAEGAGPALRFAAAVRQINRSGAGRGLTACVLASGVL